MLACLDLPALPLQLIWRLEPAWRAHPVVVIDEDRPQGTVLWACERARAIGVLPGQRYAHALALCTGLRARVIADDLIATAILELRTALHALSPRVEPAADQPGTFWLDGAGLERMFLDAPDTRIGTAWAAAIAATIRTFQLAGAIVIGYSRFATYAIARATHLGITVLRSPDDERTAAARVPLARLDLDVKLRDALARLGVTTVGQMVRLPAGGILERFGREAHRLYQLAAGERWDPIVPIAAPETPDERIVLDDEDDDIERLVFWIKGALDRLLERLATRGRALTALHVELTLKHGVGRTNLRAECIKPAAATLDSRVLLQLVHLRLSGSPPSAPVNALRVWADDVLATGDQLALFAERPRRDLRAANVAIAKLRAALGDDAIVRPVLREGHLPEASFGWDLLVRMVAATPTPREVRPLVRRIRTRPHALTGHARQVRQQVRDDGWLIASLPHGAVVRIVGPYVISGGWWAEPDRETHRAYHFAETVRGDCLWVFYDRNRQRWFLQGAVE